MTHPPGYHPKHNNLNYDLRTLEESLEGETNHLLAIEGLKVLGMGLITGAFIGYEIYRFFGYLSQ